MGSILGIQPTQGVWLSPHRAGGALVSAALIAFKLLAQGASFSVLGLECPVYIAVGVAGALIALGLYFVYRARLEASNPPLVWAAPMTGAVRIRDGFQSGTQVNPGDVVGEIEAMKMITDLTAERSGTIRWFLTSRDYVQEGHRVYSIS